MKTLIVAFICMLVVACKQKAHTYIELKIDNTHIDSTHDISDLIDNISIVQLQETEGEPIGIVHQITRKKNFLLIHDRISVNKVFLYDSSGKFIRTIVKTGFGKEDGVNLSNFWFNNNGQLEVYDYGECKIFRYDDQFNRIKVIKAPNPVFFIALRSIPHTANYIGYANYNLPDENNRDPYHIAVLDSNLNIIKTRLLYDRKFRGIPFLAYPQHFPTYKDTLRFIEAYNNHIRSLSNGEIITSYKISYTNANLPDDIMPYLKKNLDFLKNPKIHPNEKLLDLKKYFRFAGSWLENDKYIYIGSRDSVSRPFLSLANKSDNKILFTSRVFTDTIRYKLTLPPLMSYDGENDEFISVNTGKELFEGLYPDSKFSSRIINSPVVLYLVRVKLK